MSKCVSALRCVASTVCLLVASLVLAEPAQSQIAPLPLPVHVSPPLRPDTMCDKNAKLTPTPAPSAQFIVAPYGWMSGISGDMSVRDLTANVDVNFFDLLRHLRFAAMGTFEIGYGPWLFISDNIYSSIAVDHTLSLNRVQPELDLTSKMFIGQAFVGYSMSASPTVNADILLGTRVWSTTSTLNLSGAVRSAERSNSSSWADALGGLRVRWRPSQHWQFSITGDGGAGGSLNTVEGMATAGYDLSKYWWLWGAYRVLHENYQKNEFSFTGNLQGPVIGVSVHW